MIGTGNGIGIGAGNGLLSNTWGAGEELFHNDYYVYILEQIGGDFLRNQIDEEMWINPSQGRNLYYWNGTLEPKPYSGNSFYNTQSSGWVSFQTTSQANSLGWSGGGFNVDASNSIVFTPNMGFAFHIALKSAQSYDFTIKVLGTNGTETPIVFGTSAGAGIDYVLPRDNNWHAFEIPISFFTGLTFGTITNQNYLVFELGSTAGNGLEVDATFFYNPNASR